MTTFHWPSFGWDPGCSRCKTDEAILRHANYASMVEAWASPYQCGDKVQTAPIYFDDRLLIGSHDHKVHGIDVGTGLAFGAFPFSTGGPVKATGALVDLGGGVIAYIFGADDGFARAINANTGVLIWDTELDGAVRGSTVIDADAGVAFLGTTSDPGSAYGLDVTDGSIIWRFDTVNITSGDAGACEQPLSLFEGLLYVPSGRDAIALDPTDGSLDFVWHTGADIASAIAFGVTPDDDAFMVVGSTDHTLQAFNPRDRTRRWIDYQPGDVFATPVVDGPDRLIVDGEHNWRMKVAGLEAFVGEIEFVKDADPKPAPSAAIQASPAMVRPSTDPADFADVIHAIAYMANDGRWCAWQTKRDDGSNPSFKFPSGSTRSAIDIYSPPTLANGHLFGGREDGKVYAFRV